MRLKFALACWRPQELSPQIQPMIPTPLHGTLPSGHATEGFVFARILLELLRGTKGDDSSMHLWANQLMRQASRIAVNRTVAGLHFPVDSVAGTLLGLTLAEYLIGLFTGRDEFSASSFDGTKFPTNGPLNGASTDFNWEEFYDADRLEFRVSGAAARYANMKGSIRYGARSAVLQWLWIMAKSEWTIPHRHGRGKRRRNGRASSSVNGQARSAGNGRARS